MNGYTAAELSPGNVNSHCVIDDRDNIVTQALMHKSDAELLAKTLTLLAETKLEIDKILTI